MKIGDYVFRDINLFLDTFVESSSIQLCGDLVQKLDVYKWGLVEPGRKGRIIACCDRSGDAIRIKGRIIESEKWVVFFAFAPGVQISCNPELISDKILELWHDFNIVGVCNGFEVRASNIQYLVELVNGMSEI